MPLSVPRRPASAECSAESCFDSNICWRDPFGVQRAVIEQRAHLGFLAALTDDVEMFLGAIVLAGEAEELEEKRAALGVGGIVPELGAQRLDRFVELAGLQEELAWQSCMRESDASE